MVRRYAASLLTAALSMTALGGCFELTIDNDLVYSKLKTGKFPDEAEMIRAVGNRLRS